MTGEVRSALTAMLAVFVVLKLTDTVTWSWVWVLTPLWAPAIVSLTLLVVGASLIGLSRWRRHRIARELAKIRDRRAAP